MKAHEFQAAVMAAVRGRSRADAVDEVAAPLSLAEAGAMHAEVERMQHDAKRVLLDKLKASGAGALDWSRDYEVRLDVWWREGPAWFEWCPDATPSSDLRDWLCTDDVDRAQADGRRVQVLTNDATLILTEGMGAVVFRTSKRLGPHTESAP